MVVVLEVAPLVCVTVTVVALEPSGLVTVDVFVVEPSGFVVVGVLLDEVVCVVCGVVEPVEVLRHTTWPFTVPFCWPAPQVAAGTEPAAVAGVRVQAGSGVPPT